jgi:hypothetical protein
MSDATVDNYTAFSGDRRIASGPLRTVALAVKRAIKGGAANVLIFDDATGRQIDVDIRGSDKAIVDRLAQRAPHPRAESAQPGRPLSSAGDSIDTKAAVDEPRGRGRPKLGVVAREVTLLPRHWEWLAAQPGGASVALRKLVEEARRTHAESDQRRKSQESAYHFMSAIAGNKPGFEEAARALFANDRRRFRKWIASWPDDVRDHAIKLACGTDRAAPPATRVVIRKMKA